MEITSLSSSSSSYHYNTSFSTTPPTTTITCSSSWTFKDHKRFEQLLATMHYYPQDLNSWINIANQLGKTPTDVKLHYDKLLYDVVLIESGRVPLPHYVDDDCCYYRYGDRRGGGGDHVDVEQLIVSDSSLGKQIMKKKGEQWTTDEHKLFLLGLKKCGKGDWKSISRNFVTTKSPTQVASHAQKFFLRQSQSTNQNNRKRTSIHDITEVDDDSLSDLIRRGVVPLNILAQPPNVNQP